MQKIVIGTRGSDLARFQANWVAARIAAKLGIVLEVRIITTQGDRVTDRPLRELEGRGYFTREIEEALLNRTVDVAVHSFKDMPSRAPDGLAVAAVSEREDPADLLIIRPGAYDEGAGDIPVRRGAVVGTSAVRREAQLRALRPDLNSKDLRGNVPTRVTKLMRGDYDAVFLASAGVRRLGLDLSELATVRLDPAHFVRSPGQGALASKCVKMIHNLLQFTKPSTIFSRRQPRAPNADCRGFLAVDAVCPSAHLREWSLVSGACPASGRMKRARH